jgi:hypothetical protein
VFEYVISSVPVQISVEGRAKGYRSLAAECRRLAVTATDAGSQAQYEALAELWTELAIEAERADSGACSSRVGKT